MKAILLAGGTGSRLLPLTLATSKQLLPVYNKPLIYYPISTLLLAGARDILIISTPRDVRPLENLLGDGSEFGISITYSVQPEPKGIAQAILIAEAFLQSEPFMLMLGDNLLYGGGLGESLANEPFISGAKIFLQKVKNPEQYGVAEISDDGTKIVSVQEKPANAVSDLAIVGLYYFDKSAPERVRGILPSDRGELEITDLIISYKRSNQLEFRVLERGATWLDAGTVEGLSKASEFVHVIENRQGLLVSSPHEIAWRLGFISRMQLEVISKRFASSDYGAMLKTLIE